jgi:hypothetical protein
VSYAEAWRTLLGEVRKIGPEPSPSTERASPQLSLVFEETPALCPHHDAAHVCNLCPERFGTDGWGFVHRTQLKGRTPLRRCRCCGKFKPRPEWGAVDFFLCRTCEAAL